MAKRTDLNLFLFNKKNVKKKCRGGLHTDFHITPTGSCDG